MSDPSSIGSISLEQLISLNDELASLVRIGVPLESGLAKLGAEWPGVGGRMASKVAEELQRGKSLPTVMAEQPEVFPPFYRAVVEAGYRVGRPAAAMESVAVAARRIVAVRRHLVAASVYPILVVLAAWGLFAALTAWALPAVVPFLQENKAPFHSVFSAVRGWSDTAVWWGPGGFVLLLLLYAIWVRCAGSLSMSASPTFRWTLGWMPWIGRMVRDYQLACLAEIQASLIEHETPLPEALRLSASLCDIPSVAAALRSTADRLALGESFEALGEVTVKLPPLLRWGLVSGASRADWVASLRNVAAAYGERGSIAAELVHLYAPVLLTLLVGGTAAAAYFVVMIGTWFSMIQSVVNLS